MTQAKITILGCGNSTGVPSLGNNWGVCDPKNPKNRRTRCSLSVQTGSTTLIIDTGPEFREQVNRENITHIDAVLYTHMHSDHVNGIDDLRIIKARSKKRVPVFANPETLADLQARFPYLFNGGGHELYPSVIEPHEITSEQLGKAQRFGDIDFTPFQQNHGTCNSLGYRFGDMAYSVDIWKLDEAAIKALKGVKTWIVDGAAYKQTDNAVHANLDTIFALNKDIGAQNVYISSLSLAMDYETMRAELPEGYAPAYDGLSFTAEI
ncbi:MAG: MBL fold metallo-hydrolase [Alphaproteobacteria bacterium]|nr:MBL fold metallo-hydrolase [Alphaproteobacteria bacterium]